MRLNQPFGDVVSWDLIPREAISTMTLMPGSNPLFGLNTLGGALALHTKDGFSDPGYSIELNYGSDSRRQITVEGGGPRRQRLLLVRHGEQAERRWLARGLADRCRPGLRQDRLAQRDDRCRAVRRVRGYRPHRQWAAGPAVPPARLRQRLHQARQHEEQGLSVQSHGVPESQRHRDGVGQRLLSEHQDQDVQRRYQRRLAR